MDGGSGGREWWEGGWMVGRVVGGRVNGGEVDGGKSGGWMVGVKGGRWGEWWEGGWWREGGRWMVRRVVDGWWEWRVDDGRGGVNFGSGGMDNRSRGIDGGDMRGGWLGGISDK